ncbi:MAG: hypothetical protein WD529_06270 [Balneolaceae bacterium]
MRHQNVVMSLFGLLLTVLLTFTACNRASDTTWTELVPEHTPWVMIPQQEETIYSLLEAPYITLLEDLSSSSMQVTGELLTESDESIYVRAILLFPDTANEWKPVWVTETPAALLQWLAQRFHRPFAQNLYTFKGQDIHHLSLDNRSLFAVRHGSWTLFSESSFAIEEMIRTSSGELPSLQLQTRDIEPGTLIVNTSHLDRWVGQNAQVLYRPALTGSFQGGTPLGLKLNQTFEDSTEEAPLWKLEGLMEAPGDSSPLIRSISAESAPITLERYIPIPVATFSILQLPPRMVPPDQPPSGELDQHLIDNRELWQRLATALGDEIAFAAFDESGLTTSSEFLFLRRAEDPETVTQILEQLREEEWIVSTGNIYHINSLLLGQLIGSDLSPITSFYLSVFDGVVAISRNRQITERAQTDFDRRNVVLYDPYYEGFRSQFPDEISSITYVDGERFHTYVQPWLFPLHKIGALTSRFDILLITTHRNTLSDPLAVSVSSFQRERELEPYRERWLYPLSAPEISGEPVLTDLTGNGREEIVFSTPQGSVFAISADGSIVTQVSTGSDTPVGPPVVFDWYGNNQRVIMQAAGNRIYAWNLNGEMLPNFPVQAGEEITTPLQIIDVTRNGLAEMLFATADRRFHILDERGNPITGWPQTTNAVIRSRPLFQMLGSERTLIAFSENALHAWSVNGMRRDGFPLFTEARFNGSPIIYGEHILGAGSDGQLYAVGEQTLFADSLDSSVTGDSLIVQSLNVSNSPLNATPVVTNERVRTDDEEILQEDLILTQSANGSIFLINMEGSVRFTRSMAQPSSETSGPMTTDLNGNGQRDLVALAGFGRLFAWNLTTGERITDLPTTSMRFPVIRDLTRDGQMEIIAHTREGLRAWTILSLPQE